MNSMHQLLLRNGYLNPADDGTGGQGGGAEPPAKEPEGKGEKSTPAAEPQKGKISDEEAKLLKEVMAKKEKITALEAKLADFSKKFDGVDVERYQTLVQEQAKIEQERKEREEQELRNQQKWDELLSRKEQEHRGILEQVKGENGKSLQKLKEELSQLSAQLESERTEKQGLFIGNAFGNSRYLPDATNLSPSKAQRIYGDHFEVQDGKVIGYDKPRGASDRAPLVDGDGSPLGFEAVIRKLIDADPDRDLILKASLKEGAGSGAGASNKAPKPGRYNSGVERIQAGLAKLKI